MEVKNVAVVGLGYVGLPLAVMLSKHFSVIGFDVDEKRISELQNNIDHSGEVSAKELSEADLMFTANQLALNGAEVVIVCVPSPIDKNKKPNLVYIKSASRVVGENMSKGAIVVYESTVYPGVTEEICVPILEEVSGMKCGIDFKIGYSPERINPGDKKHSIDKITKVVSGMDKESLEIIDSVYNKITNTHRAPAIKVAEAAKVIENIQRDLNIALMNELAVIFDKMRINVKDVLEAAGTKWNFHKYYPGLVGGHCIGVDPYYLTYKAEELGHHPDVILAGRRINDNMHKFYAEKIVKRLSRTGGKKVLILGLTFKANVSDYRNSRVKHLIKELQDYNVKVYAYDPYLDREIIEEEFNAVCVDLYEKDFKNENCSLVLQAVEHTELASCIEKIKSQGIEVLTLKEL